MKPADSHKTPAWIIECLQVPAVAFLALTFVCLEMCIAIRGRSVIPVSADILDSRLIISARLAVSLKKKSLHGRRGHYGDLK